MLKTITISDWLMLENPMPMLDARSEGEYQQGHILGAISFPLLNNEERKLVGTCYKQNGSDQAVLLGYKLVGPKFETYLKQAVKQFPKGKLAVHCWRGGLRSRIMGNLLDSIGYEVYQVVGGYKSYRNWALVMIENDYPLHVLAGLTGAGKTDKLRTWKKEGRQVIDLEALAHHKGSAFGNLGEPDQPTQEQFENNLASTISKLNFQQPVWVEDEGRKIGRIVLPFGFYENMQKANYTFLEVGFEERAQHLLSVYGNFKVNDLIHASLKLKKRMGDLENRRAIHFLLDGDKPNWIKTLLRHYDKQYLYNMAKRPIVSDWVKTQLI